MIDDFSTTARHAFLAATLEQKVVPVLPTATEEQCVNMIYVKEAWLLLAINFQVNRYCSVLTCRMSKINKKSLDLSSPEEQVKFLL
ncbi:hypothetical protein TNCV_693731 [Trichonephila clavipes]|nr:hypothetical protein TNCV_693731 [Trichonephila clavipes]